MSTDQMMHTAEILDLLDDESDDAPIVHHEHLI